MPRELRTRKSRPNYSALLQIDDGDQAGPSGKPAPVIDDGDSGSDFALEQLEVETAQVDMDIDEDDDDDDEDDAKDDEDLEDEIVEAPVKKIINKPKPKPKPSISEPKTKLPLAKARSSISVGPALTRPSIRHNYSLPQPHVNHRHRAIPLYRRQAEVERLETAPALFSPGDTTFTNSFTSSSTATMRLGRGWGANIGPGPVWQLLEDRGWYKEALLTGNEAEEEKRRPRVYENVTFPQPSAAISKEEAYVYIPSDTTVTEEGLLKPPPPLVCSFGPFNNQTQVEMKMFDSVKISEMMKESRSHVFNAGAPVWGLDWCPTHPDDRPGLSHKQYLAISTFPSRSYSPSIGVKTPRPFNSCIQIWSLAPTGEDPDWGEMKCEIVLCIDSGPAHALKWCPLPSSDPMTTRGKNSTARKLGFLAGTFGDGSVSIYAVPYPSDITATDGEDGPIFVKLDPVLRIELEETFCWSLDWANSEVIAIGCTNGSIVVYDVSKALGNGEGLKNELLPLHHIAVHQSAIRSIAWIRVPPVASSGELLTNETPTVIASGGYDGVEGLTDLREPATNVFNRTRDVINDMVYSPFGAGVATIDHENLVKMYSASPSMLGRGHSLLESGGPVWSLHSSDHHPHIAVGSVDGTCMTTNTLRSTRRGGIPLFTYRIYQLDYNRTTEEYRMLERFLPQEMQDRSSATRAKSKNPDFHVKPVGTGAWSPEVGVHRVVWNTGNGLSNAHLLASATGSGLCRIDWLTGRWLKDKIPYYDIERMRGEVEGGMDIDEEEDSD